MTEPDAQAEITHAVNRAAAYLDQVTRQLGGHPSAGTICMILLAEHIDAMDYGDTLYAGALLTTACRISLEYRAAYIAARSS